MSPGSKLDHGALPPGHEIARVVNGRLQHGLQGAILSGADGEGVTFAPVYGDMLFKPSSSPLRCTPGLLGTLLQVLILRLGRDSNPLMQLVNRLGVRCRGLVVFVKQGNSFGAHSEV